MRKLIIAIDGFSGTGKSSTAKAVAKRLGYTYIDSGAMYRATTLFFINNGINPEDDKLVSATLNKIQISLSPSGVFLNDTDVTDEIRTMKVNELVSKVSSNADVRKEMVRQQQEMGASKNIVMDGRDIGTVVFPEADLKVFMTANTRIRAERRQKELAEKGIQEELDVIEKNLKLRDQMDSSRTESPLKKASESVEIDTSNLTFDDQVQKIVELAEKRIYEN